MIIKKTIFLLAFGLSILSLQTNAQESAVPDSLFSNTYLQSFVGNYQQYNERFETYLKVTIYIESNNLFQRIGNYNPSIFQPKSYDEFIEKEEGWILKFVRDDENRITGYTVRTSDGRSISGEKIE